MVPIKVVKTQNGFMYAKSKIIEDFNSDEIRVFETFAAMVAGLQKEFDEDSAAK
jgi:hypothetical protein